MLHVSPDTVKRDWRLAKLWLLRELEGDERRDRPGPSPACGGTMRRGVEPPGGRVGPRSSRPSVVVTTQGCATVGSPSGPRTPRDGSPRSPSARSRGARAG